MAVGVVPDWLVSLGEAIGTSGGAIWFLVNRHDRMVDTGKADHGAAMAGIEHAKNEAADALQAAIYRFDSRHEDLRRELSGQVTNLAARIDNQTREMATRQDLQSVTNALNKLTERIDRRLDREHN